MDACKYFIWENPPENFMPICEVGACYVEIQDKILLLERSLTESEGGTWCVPAGKVELEELPIEGAIRELFEESGIVVSASQLIAIGTLYMQKPIGDFVYHLFQVPIHEIPEVRLSSEHTSYMWVNRKDIEPLPLISGGREALDYYLRKKRKL